MLDVAYAPTGKEFISGSYDKTIRIFNLHQAHSREIYHTKRMQRVTCVGWSSDNRFVYSGSDEMNIRLWKAVASEKLAPVNFDISIYVKSCFNTKLLFRRLHQENVQC